jgi:hypothetical protein
MTQDRPGIGALETLAATAAGRQTGLPPVHLWNPDHCGPIDIVIGADGVWRHEGRPILRPELVRLFSTVLRRDADGYCLVTPVEKLTIQVEDLPFRAVAVETESGDLTFITDQGDRTTAGPDHELVVETTPGGEPRPRVHVRADLWARITRPVFYELVERAVECEGRLTLASGGRSFDLGALEAGG